MNKTLHTGLAALLAVVSAATMAQSFDQRGPTGDNRAATGNPGTQASPTENAKEAARQKRPMKVDGKVPEKTGAAHQDSAPDSAAPTASPGTPAENHAAPESAK